MCDLNHDPSLKKRQHFSVWATDFKFFLQRGICLHSRLKQFHCPMWNTFVRTKRFIWLSLSHNDISKKNTVCQNLSNSITNQDIDLKFLQDMNWCMAHIFSEKCLFTGATFSFWIQVMSEPSRCGQHKEERWLNGSAPDCKSIVLGLNPAPPQHTANSVIP